MESEEPIGKKQRGQVERYFIWGVVTVAFNVYVFYLLQSKMNMDYQLANFIDWILTVLFSYIVNKIFVFRSSKNSFQSVLKEIVPYFGTRVLSLIIELILLWLFVSVLHANTTISKVIGHSFALVINYFLSKLLFMKI